VHVSFFANLVFSVFYIFIDNDQSKKLNASEGRLLFLFLKAAAPLPFREAINNFVGNLSETEY
jgi:hypothetical protein